MTEGKSSDLDQVLITWFNLRVTIGLYILLFMFESLPSSVILCGLVSQLVHLSIIRTFPFFFLTSLPFILGIVLFFANHYLAFSYFSSFYYPASEVLAYFTLCVWLVPFMFFISLSANENVLPTQAECRPFLASRILIVTPVIRGSCRSPVSSDALAIEDRVDGQGMWVFLGHSMVQKGFGFLGDRPRVTKNASRRR
ncbi:Protein TEX261 [Chionoecetes opilio]|uniref:Protein TEX261 n=1 Tax=Chionoecetes opilio TaxID=41210 RepID=A0A8J5BXJ8_CHIOP|nr:Protein TEX261 [Chionoecetes opilio]